MTSLKVILIFKSIPCITFAKSLDLFNLCGGLWSMLERLVVVASRVYDVYPAHILNSLLSTNYDCEIPYY